MRTASAASEVAAASYTAAGSSAFPAWRTGTGQVGK